MQPERAGNWPLLELGSDLLALSFDLKIDLWGSLILKESKASGMPLLMVIRKIFLLKEKGDQKQAANLAF